MVDKCSHAFAESFHIATVHEKYGSNHTEAQVAIEIQDEKEKDQEGSRTFSETTVHLSIAECTYNKLKPGQVKEFLSFCNEALSNPYISRQGPPPKFL